MRRLPFVLGDGRLAPYSRETPKVFSLGPKPDGLHFFAYNRAG
jgi:hypothetical protein